MRILVAAVAIGLFSLSLTAARAEHWCGFIDKQGSQVRCGFSSLDECKHAIGSAKDAYCEPDPAFARNDRGPRIQLAVFPAR